MNATSQNPSEPTAGNTKRMLAGVWKNLPCENAVVLFSDATANRDDLEALLGRPVIDVTPVGHITHAKRVVQYPIDLTRLASPKRFLSVVRGVLTEFRDARRGGVITHRPLVGAIKKLAEPFASRIVKSAYFGSGSDRASNDWHERCDLVIVVGTPRVPGEAVQRRLIQFGDFTSAGEDGRWGPCRWKATTETGEELIVEGLGYAHPAWERAHRSLVRAAIIQAAGRGRSLLETGCDVVIISTEECGFPVVNNRDIELSETETNALAVITELSARESYRTTKTLVRLAVADAPIVSTSEIAHRMGLMMRGTQKILTRLESRRLVIRLGERGGWLLSAAGSDPVPDVAGSPETAVEAPTRPWHEASGRLGDTTTNSRRRF